MKRISILSILLSILILFSFGINNPTPSPQIIKVRKVVIDAGHGGYDGGAVGKKFLEKNIALSIALKVGNCIKEAYPEVEVIYTRKTDVFVELYNRARIANENKADLFISIHCNSSKSTSAVGTETWVMGLSKSQANLEVAKQENATILMESDYSNQYDGFDPNSAEANIIFSLYQNVYLDQSLNLAAKIQEQFDKRMGRVNRGVKQAGFLVLYKTTMPGILIETGFISNPEEEEFIASDIGQAQIASAIFRAFKSYKAEIEGNPYIDDDNDTDVAYENIPDTTSIKPVIIDTSKVVQEIYFRVQFATSDVKKPTNSQEFKSLEDVRVYYHGGLYKYTTGNMKTLDEAVKLQQDVQQKGYKGAFVVAFLNEQRINTTDAEQLLKNQKK
jgi:N-acetylmuramoyl-L-alanine amidase